MKETWRWYGELDKISLSEIAQTGAKGIVTALHEIPYGEIWNPEQVCMLRDKISSSGLDLHWDVVESLPIHENIKMGTGDLKTLFGNYRRSLKNLANAGIKTICYNFMPILDWTRTHLKADLPRGGTALRFSAAHMAAFEINMLGREEARQEYTDEAIENGLDWISRATEEDKTTLLASIMAGLPGKFTRYNIDGLKKAVALYNGIDKKSLRENYGRFLNEVIPTAEEFSIKMCVHPDDPPRNILGLPRIVSSEDDLDWVINYHKSESNGLTLCSGSLGAGSHNNVTAIAKKFSKKIFFAHLRNVSKENDGSFEEASHLNGDINMTELITVVLNEEKRRIASGISQGEVPFRPDHGHELLSDKKKNTHPGYPLVGRLRGLSELRGVIHAINNR
ncbi:MAG: mannonate dehydratase [Paracoccaceae bacterium]|nr:mannonate dehydratase [Paracoccaceae bacterium]